MEVKIPLEKGLTRKGEGDSCRKVGIRKFMNIKFYNFIANILKNMNDICEVKLSLKENDHLFH